MVEIILASASPRRWELLKQIGLSFTVQVSNVEENKFKGDNPQKWVEQLAKDKASSVASSLKQGLVIGADTVVFKDGKILGKPKSECEAYDMLSFLSGAEHQVLTGIAIIDAMSGESYIDSEITRVKFRQLTEQEINAYIATGEPFDKAGAYGIQGLGALLVESITGCYFNVVGLPLQKLAQGLKRFGVEVLK